MENKISTIKITALIKSCVINNIHFFFSALAIAEASKECYPDDESFTGSMLSLAHSNSSSSCSFPAGNI